MPRKLLTGLQQRNFGLKSGGNKLNFSAKDRDAEGIKKSGEWDTPPKQTRRSGAVVPPEVIFPGRGKIFLHCNFSL